MHSRISNSLLKTALLCVAMILSLSAYAQHSLTVKAQLTDEKTGEPVGFATASLTVKGEKEPAKYVLSDSEGNVNLQKVRKGVYIFKAELMGYKPLIKEISVEKNLDLGVLKMAEDAEASTDTVAEDPKVEEIDWKDKYLRLQAEFDNYRKRTLKDKMSLVESGGENVIKALLPVVDDVDRALAAMEKSDDVEALRGGVRLISQKFNEVMRQQGVSEIEAVGKEFDVDHHEAVARFPIEGKASGEIIDVVQKGYKLGEKVIRYAKVVVAE